MKRNLIIVIAAFLFVALIRITAPSDLATGDQPYQADYIRDIVHRDAWIVQHLSDGTPATKPPLYNWIAAAAVRLTGRETEFVLKLPSLMAGLIALLLLWDLTRRYGGEEAALYAGLLLVCSTMYSKQIYFARTDMLLTMFIVLQFWSALRAEEQWQRKFVVMFWSAAALAMLTKGPVGVIIPIVALSIWWWRRGELRVRWRQMHLLLGLTISVAVFAAWFLAAIAIEPLVFDQLVFAETLDRFRAFSSKSKENRHVLYYVPHFIGRMAPASIFAIAGVMVLLRSGEDKQWVGSFLWWLAGTFVMLSLVPSKRADRLFPLFPAAAILAGWTLANRPAIAKWGLRLGGTLMVAIAIAAIFSNQPSPVMVAAAVVGIAGLACVLLRRPRHAVIALCVGMLSVISVYQHHLSSSAQVSQNKSSAVGMRALCQGL